jgi:hypothetical protein
LIIAFKAVGEAVNGGVKGTRGGVNRDLLTWKNNRWCERHPWRCEQGLSHLKEQPLA